jgi:IclR family pca regulon transcriptional regulator
MTHPAETPPPSIDRNYVASLARGLSVLRAFTSARPRMTLAEVARHAGMNRAAARRFLLTFVREGYADTDGKYFTLTPRILELGFSAVAALSFAEIAEPVMEQLSTDLQETVLAAVLDGEDVLYVACASAQRVISLDIAVGSRLPAFTMSTGRVLLAALPDEQLQAWLDALHPTRYTSKTTTSTDVLRREVLAAREADYAITDEEFEIGFRSLSVPVRDQAGAVVAALNVCCPSRRVGLSAMREDFLPQVRQAAQDIGRLLPEAYARHAPELRQASRPSTQR